ncbi:MAG: flavodoxin [Eubacterium sp.]|nr:flavodoxin [Eubacterium sp.]
MTLSACKGQDTGEDQTVQPAQETAETAENQEADSSAVLVAYFSRTQTTEAVAQEIAAQLDADIFEIVPQEPYPEDYNETVARFRRERDEEARPAVSGQVENMGDYDTIFVGYPIWGSTMPHVVRTFLEQYDFSGKKIIPFCTSGGSGLSGSVEVLKALCPDATLLEGRDLTGADAGEISAWLEGLDIPQ